MGDVDVDGEPGVLPIEVGVEDVDFEGDALAAGLRPFATEGIPVYLFKEIVVFDVLDAAIAHTQAICWLNLQEPFQDIPGLTLEHTRNHGLLHRDVLVHLHLVLVVVRW